MPKRRPIPLTSNSTNSLRPRPKPRVRAAFFGWLVLIALVAARPLLASDNHGKASARAASKSSSPEPISELWVNPPDIASRDLFLGPGGVELAPAPDGEFQFRGEDKKGHSKGYDVADSQGRKWAVKLGDEAQSEVAVSRILWAIGFHQPAVYYVARWKLVGAPDQQADAMPGPGRFRFGSDHKSLGDWSWSDNPFAGTRELRGLIVANLVLNNWDLTTTNNRLYRVGKKSKHNEKWYVVQDVGGSLGKTRWPIGTRNNLADFESESLIKSAQEGKVEMTYRARHRILVGQLTPEDVVWTCELLDRLSDRQLDDAFRAGGYPKPDRERYIRKIREKIHEGLALQPRAGEAHG